MKEKLIIFTVLFCLLMLTGCSKSSTEVKDGYISYYITIINYSSYDLTELVISMVGLDDMQQISILRMGYTSQFFEFQLPVPSGDTPFSYGDYNLSYLQNNEEMDFSITQPEAYISVFINDDGYIVETLISHLITIINDSSYNVTEMEIFMEGAFGFHQISELIPGECSQEFEVNLINYTGPTSDNYGYFCGSYLQNNQVYPYLFFPPSTNIIMHINNDDYTIEDVGN